MKNETDDAFLEEGVTYTLSMNGQFYIVENVPARVHRETGEQLFSPDTVERLHSILKTNVQPKRIVETPVYDFSTFEG